MRQFQCPRCATIVNAMPGALPVCPTCGFGSAGGAAPAAAGGLSGGAIAAIIIAVVLVLGGAAAAAWYFLGDDEGGGGSGGPLSQAAAEQLVASTLVNLDGGAGADPEAFLESIEEPFLDDLRRVEADISGDGGEFVGTISGTFSIEWGTGDVTHVTMSFGAGGVTFTVELFCGPGGDVMVLGGDVYESRPTGEDCASEFDDEFGSGDTGDELSDFDIVSVTPHADGSVSAVLENETARVELEIDADGRLTSMSMTGEEAGTEFMVEMRFEYGSLRAISLPTATERLPAAMFGSEMLDDDGESTLFEIDGAPGGLPRSEFEVRLRDYGCDCIVASFDMAAASATDDGFIFTWLGDGDGLLEAGDSFQVSKPGTDVYYDHEIVIWDTWADAEVGSELLPGPPLPLLALALVVGAVVLRRRR